jgi:3-oxoacyl-[acyl-carrier protein] reductase
MDLGLGGRVALVGAASRGLGFAAAQALAREGARVALCARGEQVHRAAEALRRETGAQVLGFQADLTQPADVDRLMQAALAELGGLDILIANAGGPPPGPFLALTPDDWQRAFDQVVMSTVRLCAAAIPHLIARGGGSIVASQSYSVKQPVEHLTLSNALRLAVIGLMKSLAAELGPQGVRVNTVNPGWTLTERVEALMADRAARSGRTLGEEAARLTAEIPLGRMAAAEEYGRAVAWLASPAASYIHGHALFVDGGIVRAAL